MTRDLLENPAQHVGWHDTLRQIQMRLQGYAVQRHASAFEPFKKCEEVVAPIVFDPQVILEAELVDQ